MRRSFQSERSRNHESIIFLDNNTKSRFSIVETAFYYFKTQISQMNSQISQINLNYYDFTIKIL